MPLQASVTLGKKVSANYQSTSVQVTLVAELPADLAGKPELQEQLARLFGQAEQAVERRVQACAAGTGVRSPQQRNGTNRNAAQANEYLRNNGNQSNGGMTASQRRAICAIAERSGLNPEQEAHDHFGVPLDGLSLKAASDLIDALKHLAATGNRS